MPMPLIALLLLALAPVAARSAQAPSPVQRETYDYWRVQREMIARGQQALLLCNGLFTSSRTLEQVFAQELKILAAPIGTADGGDYTIDRPRRAVAVGTAAGPVPVMRAAFREGLGCIALAPDQTFDDIDRLPILATPPLPGDPATTTWPEGDLVPQAPLPAGIDPVALQAASDWTFTRASNEQVTLSLLVVHQGRIVHERYASGVNMTTRTRTWSTAKSLAATLIGILVDQGRMTLDGPLDLPWLPVGAGAEHDPRAAVTLRHLLNMSSGLDPVDNAGLEYATGSGLAYWAGASSARGARQRALIRAPGTSWDYENYDTLAAVAAMKRAMGSDRDYLGFPRQALLDRLGMRSTILSTDRFGDFVLSSQVYTNARDLARLGLLYLRNGMWGGERLLSEAWIRFVRTPAPATKTLGNQYGGHFWLVPDTRTDVPKDAYSTNGNRGQYTIIVPSHDLVIVRRGLDYGRQGFNPLDLTREVLKSIKWPAFGRATIRPLSQPRGTAMINRRAFLTKTAAAAAGLAAFPRRGRAQQSSPNDTVNVAIIGLRGDNKGHPTWTARGRGQDHYQGLAGIPNVRITHVVDIDERHFQTALPGLKQRHGQDPKTETDFRRVLENKDVDAVTIAAPDHWHALMTIWACQAGKDVYVEKPIHHNIVEGRRMIEAAQRHNRVVQAGLQRRSGAGLAKAVQFLRAGGLGKIYAGKTVVYRQRDPIGVVANSAVPAGVNYDMWLGPAPERPFNENHFHYHWHFFWEYGTTDLGNTGVHSMDVTRALLGKQEHPRTVYCAGGLYEAGAPTDQTVPNTQYTTYKYADGTELHCDLRNWYTGPAEAQGVFIYGEKGWMDFSGNEARVFFGKKNEPGPSLAPAADEERESHFENFISAIRSRKTADLKAPVEEGHFSTSLCHLGNISYRLGRSITFDGAAEKFVGDTDADKLLARTYRQPYKLPEKI